MKKLYSAMAVAALGCMTMMAGGRGGSVVSTLPQNQFANRAETKTTLTRVDSKVCTSFSSISEMTGEYIWTYTSLFANDDSYGIPVTIVAGTAANEIRIMLPIDGLEGIKATVDFTAQTVTVPNDQYLGEDQYGDEWFYFKDYDPNTMKILDGVSSRSTTVGRINGLDIKFDDMEIFACGDKYNEQNNGLYFAFYASTLVNDREEEPEDMTIGYHMLDGVASMVDGWMYPGFGITTQLEQYIINDIEVWQNNTNSNMIRLMNPYATSLFPTQTSYYKEGGVIDIDITDPTFVVITPMWNGIKIDGEKYMNQNFEGFYVDQGYSKEQIIGATGYVASTYVNNVVNVPTCTFQCDYDGRMYHWVDNQQQSVEGYMKAKITLPNLVGVDEIASDNGVTEYYNLQGVRVANPEAGQLVIARQGGKATKMIVR